MNHYKYVIVGGGMTADSAVKGIRDFDTIGTVAIFSEEKVLPYNRPPLSKGVWKGEQLDTIWRKTDQYKVDFYPSITITHVSPSDRFVKSGDGQSYTYEKLLLATGGSTRKLAFGNNDMIYFRTQGDYTNLRIAADKHQEFVVIGGGFIGSEIAAALAMNNEKVTMILPEEGIGRKIYPKGLSSFLVKYYNERGVVVRAGESVKAIEGNVSRYVIKTSSGKSVSAGCVVAGLGITPNDSLAKSAGLATDNGIIVDSLVRTTDHDVFAAGDVANFYNSALDKRMRVEHEDNANKMGTIAGHNMTGRMERYDYLPFFYSDLFDLGFEAVGELDSRLETYEDWIEQYMKGVVYYLADGLVKGALLWNTWGKVDEARELVNSKKSQTKMSLKGMIRD